MLFNSNLKEVVFIQILSTDECIQGIFVLPSFTTLEYIEHVIFEVDDFQCVNCTDLSRTYLLERTGWKLKEIIKTFLVFEVRVLKPIIHLCLH